LRLAITYIGIGRMNYKKILNNILFVIAIILITQLLNSCKGESDNTIEDNAGTPVQVIHPVITYMNDYLELNANTAFLNKETVRATFQGFIEKTYKNIGDIIKPGDKLFQIRTKELVSADTAKLIFGNENFQGSITIKAKSSGVLTELDYHSGDFISDGELLAVVSNPSSLVIKLSVPFENVSKIRLNENCEITFPGGEKIPGVIEKKIPAVDSGTQTQTYLIMLSVNKEIPENLNVIVKIPVKAYKDAVVLPKSSLMTDVTENIFWVMKLINDSTAIRVNVTKGIESDSLIQILDPKLSVSDNIILNGAYGLPYTSKIELVK
jgi:multidrug efflux pump subunit AcrA (membrane-fusion protein)